MNFVRLRKKLLGNQEHNGLITKILLYLLITGVGFVYLYPIFVIISTSAKDAYDLVNPLVNWFPTKITFVNYERAFSVLGGFNAVYTTILYMLLFAIAQTVSSALIAYGFAKFEFWGKGLLFALMIATFVLPPQVTFLSKYVMFNDFGFLADGSILFLPKVIYTFLLPSLLGQGIKSALFIFIFYQFFKMAPKSLDEAAYIDGAGYLRTFATINMRLATPAIIVVFIFSFVWNWNETYLSDSYFGDHVITLQLALRRFKTYFERLYPSNTSANPLLRLNEGIQMAGTLLAIIPLLIVYLFVERSLIESIDKAGITGE